MTFDILCSKGTYIRSFARDMGKVTDVAPTSLHSAHG